MERERILLVDGGAGRLRVSDGGAGEPAVVFLHGLGSDLETWRAQLDHLRPGRRAVAYDQRGHGGSDRARDGVYTIEALARDLEAVANALGLRTFFLVGHSLSGTVITSYAGAHPERVAGLVYVDAVGDFGAVPGVMEQQLRAEESPAFGAAQRAAFFAGMLGPPAKAATRDHVLAALARLDPPAFAALRRSMADFRVGGRLSSYRAPILAIEAVGAEYPIMASKVIAGATRTTLSGVSHWLMMDDPEAFDRALDPFIGFSRR